ncbi:MAG: pirin family protein [Vicinamibacteria bacterium]|nr:pirin family protein [Vicinamibacteria bacterium]
MSDTAMPGPAEVCAADPATGARLEPLPGRASDLMGLPIRRLLPTRGRRLIGPWCFLDGFGPTGSDAGQSPTPVPWGLRRTTPASSAPKPPSHKLMDVAPHPHIGLQTVSWLLAGEILHRDSTGATGVGRPGVLNLMTSGRGIAHSEETPPDPTTHDLHGVQLWVALPETSRHVAPGFEQREPLLVAEERGARARLVMGEAAGTRSPATTFSPLCAVDLELPAQSRLVLPLEPGFEHALLPLAGEVRVGDAPLAVDTLYDLGTGRRELCVQAGDRAGRALLIGGAPFGERIVMWWNFVARDADEIVAAREAWQRGERFGAVAGYPGERLPAPAMLARPQPR